MSRAFRNAAAALAACVEKMNILVDGSTAPGPLSGSEAEAAAEVAKLSVAMLRQLMQFAGVPNWGLPTGHVIATAIEELQEERAQDDGSENEDDEGDEREDVQTYLRTRLGVEGRADLAEMPLDSVVGIECAEAIDAAATLTDAIRRAHGDWPKGQEQRTQVAAVAVNVCEVFAFG